MWLTPHIFFVAAVAIWSPLGDDFLLVTEVPEYYSLIVTILAYLTTFAILVMFYVLNTKQTIETGGMWFVQSSAAAKDPSGMHSTSTSPQSALASAAPPYSPPGISRADTQHTQYHQYNGVPQWQQQTQQLYPQESGGIPLSELGSGAPHHKVCAELPQHKVYAELPEQDHQVQELDSRPTTAHQEQKPHQDKREEMP